MNIKENGDDPAFIARAQDAVARVPKPDHVKIKGNWESAIGKALKKERPKEGWPNIEKKKPAK